MFCILCTTGCPRCSHIPTFVHVLCSCHIRIHHLRSFEPPSLAHFFLVASFLLIARSPSCFRTEGNLMEVRSLSVLAAQQSKIRSPFEWRRTESRPEETVLPSYFRVVSLSCRAACTVYGAISCDCDLENQSVVYVWFYCVPQSLAYRRLRCAPVFLPGRALIHHACQPCHLYKI